MNILLQQLTEEVNARGYSEKTLTSYLAANDHLIRYFDPPISIAGSLASAPFSLLYQLSYIAG
jgi:hypothetical protein